MAIIEPELDFTSSCSPIKLDEYLKLGYYWNLKDLSLNQKEILLGISPFIKKK